MWSFRFAVLLMIAPCIAWGEDQGIEAILKSSKEIVNEAQGIAGRDSQDLGKVAPLAEEGAWLTGSQVEVNGSSSDAGETAQQRAWNEIAGEVNKGAATLSEGPPRPPVPEDVMYVYISLSMPEETIRSLFMQALQEKELRSTIFVLRGWKPPGINLLVARLNELFPEAQKLRDLPNVQINPNLFEQQGVQTVPTFSTKDKQGRWGTVVGSTSLKDAVNRIERNSYDGEVIGPTFDIEEPNILKLINERIAKVDWQQHVERVKKDVLTKRTSGRALPYATKDDSYLVDLTIINNRDLAGTSGEVFARAGVSINPFDYMTTQKRYVFFDANSDGQVAQALRWREENSYTTMITTEPARTVERRKAVIERLSQPVFEINEMLISRFKIREVPSIAYQEGKMLRVDVVKAKDLVAASQGERTTNE